MVDINDRLKQIKQSKRNSGQTTRDYWGYFPKVDGIHRQVILKTTKLVDKDAYIYNIRLPAKGYVMCNGGIATKLLNDFPEYVEAVASTMMHDEQSGQTGTFCVEKTRGKIGRSSKTSYWYQPINTSGMPKEFDMGLLKLKSISELQDEFETSKVEKEVAKLKKTIGIKAKAKAQLEKELGTKIDDDLMEEHKVKTKKSKK